MKRFISIIFILALAGTLSGCDDTFMSGAQSSNIDVETIDNKKNNLDNNNIEVIEEIDNINELQSGDSIVIDDKTPPEVIKTYTTGDEYTVDIVVGDEYYATQIADMSVNFENYEGKVVEIEGFGLINAPWTFVGRYSENAICPTCPVGYAYYEYEWHGDEKLNFGDEETWLRVTGKLTHGNDGDDYYYIDAYKIEVFDKWGEKSTVSN